MTAAAKVKSLARVIRKEHTVGESPEMRSILTRFASGLRTLRGTKTQAAVATKIGISTQQYSNIERGLNWPSLPVYIQICLVFRVALPRLMK